MTGRVAALVAVAIVWTGFVALSVGGWLVGTRLIHQRAAWKAPNPRPMRLHLKLRTPFYALILAIGVAWALFDVDAGSLGDIVRWCALVILPFAVTVTVFQIAWELPPKQSRSKSEGLTVEQAVQRQTTRGSLLIGITFLGAVILGAQIAGFPPWRSFPVYDGSEFSVAYPPGWVLSEMDDSSDHRGFEVDNSPEVSFHDPETPTAAIDVYVYPSSSPGRLASELLPSVFAAGSDVLRKQEIEVPGAADATLEELGSGVSLFAQQELHLISIAATTTDDGLVHLVLTAPEEDFDSYEATFDRVIESLRLATV